MFSNFITISVWNWCRLRHVSGHEPFKSQWQCSCRMCPQCLSHAALTCCVYRFISRWCFIINPVIWLVSAYEKLKVVYSFSALLNRFHVATALSGRRVFWTPYGAVSKRSITVTTVTAQVWPVRKHNSNTALLLEADLFLLPLCVEWRHVSARCLHPWVDIKTEQMAAKLANHSQGCSNLSLLSASKKKMWRNVFLLIF